ncbi:MAG: hypothetical protein ACRDTF_25545 [Pseudonocardiaceae bacterium]
MDREVAPVSGIDGICAVGFTTCGSPVAAAWPLVDSVQAVSTPTAKTPDSKQNIRIMARPHPRRCS